MLHAFGLESPDGPEQDVGLLEMTVQFNLSELRRTTSTLRPSNFVCFRP